MNVRMALVYRLHPQVAGNPEVWCREMRGMIVTMVFAVVWCLGSWSRCLG